VPVPVVGVGVGAEDAGVLAMLCYTRAVARVYGRCEVRGARCEVRGAVSRNQFYQFAAIKDL